MVTWRSGWVAALLLLAVIFPASAAPLRVAVAGVEPFVVSTDGIWGGLSVDIWQKVAAMNSWDYEFVGYPDEDAAVKALTRGEVDVVVAEVPISSDALAYAEFSQPYFRAGLQIMVDGSRPHTLRRLFEDLDAWGHLKIFWGIGGIVLLLTVVVTLFERRHNPDFPKKWGEGLAEAFYYVISLTLTGKSTYKGFPGVLGRLVLVVWMLFGIVTVAFLTSSITAAMTVEKLQSHINGPQDLPGHTIGAIKEGKAVGYLSRQHIDATLYPNLDEAVKGLLRGEVRAIVGSAPLLQYYDANHPKLPITEVGPVFAPYNYGFALAPGSPLRKPLNTALLRLQESGVLFELGQKYFGTVYQP
jgi:polar amino acid transport system substrate-binding protein